MGHNSGWMHSYVSAAAILAVDHSIALEPMCIRAGTRVGFATSAICSVRASVRSRCRRHLEYVEESIAGV